MRSNYIDSAPQQKGFSNYIILKILRAKYVSFLIQNEKFFEKALSSHLAR